MNNNNNSVVIETPNSPRSVVMTPPRSLRSNSASVMTRQGLDNLRRMRRTIMSFSNAGLIGRRINFNNSNRPNASNYTKNEKKMKKNSDQNKNTNRITWKNKDVNNFPIDPINSISFEDSLMVSELPPPMNLGKIKLKLSRIP